MILLTLQVRRDKTQIITMSMQSTIGYTVWCGHMSLARTYIQVSKLAVTGFPTIPIFLIIIQRNFQLLVYSQ